METKANQFKALQILHAAMLIGMVLFSIVSVVVIMKGSIRFANPSLGKSLQVIALLLTAALAGTGFFLFNKRIQSISDTANATERLGIYRSAAIIRWAMIEAPVLFIIICFMLTGNYAFLGLAIALMILFASTAPLKNKIVQQLELNDNEIAQLEGQSE